MDTSEIYIKMCDCFMIQDEWGQHPRDIVVDRRTGKLTGRKGVEVVWLPHQPQLQGMLNEKFTPWGKSSMFHRWVKKQEGVIAGKFIGDLSMEQLWLAFVMHELHSKKWDGKWVKEKEDKGIKP